MTKTAIASFPKDKSLEETWRTKQALDELRPLLVAKANCNKMLRHQTAQSVIKKLLKYKKNLTKKINACILRHKKALQNKLCKKASDKAKDRWKAFRTLTGEKREAVKQSVPGEAFAAHFESIYSKTSKSNLLGLREEEVGPKAETRADSSGPPRYQEVLKATVYRN